MESIKTHKRNGKLKEISALGFSMESYVSEDDVRVQFYVRNAVDVVK